MRAIVDDALADQVRRLERERDKLAAQLATLRSHSLAFFDAVANLRRIGPPAVEGTSAEIDAYCDSMEALESALTAPAPAVEAYTRRVQTEECELAIRIVAARKTSEIITGERAAAMDVGGKTPLRALVADCSAGALADVEDALRARARELRGGR